MNITKYPMALLSFIIVGCLTASTQGALVAHWDFNSVQTTSADRSGPEYLDVSGNGHDADEEGTVYSFDGTYASTPGKNASMQSTGSPVSAADGGYFDFRQDEVDYETEGGYSLSNDRLNISSLDSFTLAANAGMTLAAWVNPGDGADGWTTGNADYAYLVGFGSFGDNPILTMQIDPNGKLNGWVEGDGGDDQVEVTSSGMVTAGSWTHVAISYDRANDLASLYINGELDGTADISVVGDGALAFGLAHLGSRTDSTVDKFIGSMDDVRVYDEVLGATQIANLASTNGVSTELSDGLDAYWKFDGDATDSSGFGRDLTAEGGVTLSGTGKVGSGSAAFDDNGQYVYNGDILNPGAALSNYSWQAWIKTDQTSGNDDYILATKGNFTIASRVEVDNNLWSFKLHPNNGWDSAQGPDVADTNWHHVVTTFSTTDGMTVWLDGSPTNYPAFTLPGIGGHTGFYVGADQDGSGRDFKGQIDEVALWTRTLSSNEVAALYNEGQGISIPLPTTFPPVIGSFTASPVAFTNGQTVTLSWSVTDAESVSIDNGVGVVPATGSTNLQPAATTTWTLSATGGTEIVTAEATAFAGGPFDRILVDFGTSTETTASPDMFGHSWNNISSTAVQTREPVFNRNGIAAAGVTIQVTDTFANTSSNSSGNEPIYVPTAAGDFVYIARSSDGEGRVIISGLDPSGTTAYDLKFYLTTSRQLPQKFISDYTVDGAASATVSLEAVGNESTVASVNGAVPDASGELEVIIGVNVDSDDFAGISVMEVIARDPSDPTTPDPEPRDPSIAVAPGAWTIAILPDTQYYSRWRPGIFSAQTIWLRNHIKNYNIKFALHLGDITDQNTAAQWEAARESLAVLDGYLPYCFVPGNHDGSSATTLLNQYFDYSDYSSRPHFGGAKEVDNLENTYHTFSIGGYDWIVLSLAWGAPDAAVAWADGVLAAHPDHKAILVTHAYMYNDDTRYDWAVKGAAQSWNPHAYSYPDNPNDGQELWDGLVKSNNFVLTVNGHVLGDGTGFLTTPNDEGQNVHQMLVNYQHLQPLYGNGFLRLLTVNPDGTVRATSYSMIDNEFNTAADQQFTFDFEWYSPPDTNANGTADYYDAEIDSDGDGLSNYDEFIVFGSSPTETDSDGDGIDDGLEVQIGTSPSVSEKQTLDALIGTSDAFGYYTQQEMIDSNPGSLLTPVNGTNAEINVELEATDDLTTPFAPISDHPVEWSHGINSNKHLLRVSGGQ